MYGECPTSTLHILKSKRTESSWMKTSSLLMANLRVFPAVLTSFVNLNAPFFQFASPCKSKLTSKESQREWWISFRLPTCCMRAETVECKWSYFADQNLIKPLITLPVLFHNEVQGCDLMCSGWLLRHLADSQCSLLSFDQEWVIHTDHCSC